MINYKHPKTGKIRSVYMYTQMRRDFTIAASGVVSEISDTNTSTRPNSIKSMINQMIFTNDR